MTAYTVALSNTYQTTESPLVFNVGYENQKSMTYNCITKMDTSDFVVYDTNGTLTKINNNTYQARDENSYSVQVFDLTQDNPPIIFSFYVFRQFFVINADILLRTINRELPPIYRSSESLNNADNVATAGVIQTFYNYIYKLWWNGLTSVGSGTSYNSAWELVFVGANNFLQNAAYPSAFLKTLMQVNTQTSTQAFSLATTFSRLVFQFTGIASPVQVAYEPLGKRYLIKIFYNDIDAWILGDVDFSILGDTTILSSFGSNPFLWIISVVAERLMPAYVKYSISYFSQTNFEANFDTAIVDADDYVNPAIIYDAYKVVNNNNVFNTQGFLLNP